MVIRYRTSMNPRLLSWKCTGAWNFMPNLAQSSGLLIAVLDCSHPEFMLLWDDETGGIAKFVFQIPRQIRFFWPLMSVHGKASSRPVRLPPPPSWLERSSCQYWRGENADEFCMLVNVDRKGKRWVWFLFLWTSCNCGLPLHGEFSYIYLHPRRLSSMHP